MLKKPKMIYLDYAKHIGLDANKFISIESEDDLDILIYKNKLDDLE